MLTALDAPARLDHALESLRTREFRRLDREGLAYLDYTGSALYAECQVRSHHDALERGVFGNPHSENDPARASGDLIERARADVLRFFDADPDRYVVCFTANTSAAVKLVAESYPFDRTSVLALSADNHNSINGIREFARRAGTRVEYLPLDAELRLSDAVEYLAAARRSHDGRALFAFPAQSNFSGIRHPLSLIEEAHRLGFDVLLDAAAFAPSNSLSIDAHQPDFVAVSFYKLFGYPTGVGALVARRDALARLRRPWFDGGTVELVSVQNDMHRLRQGGEAFEDGTPDFLSIAALAAGFALLADIGMPAVHAHVTHLGSHLLDGLLDIAHNNGRAAVAVYGPHDATNRGGTVAFNVLTDHGQRVSFSEVERRAREAGVAVRSGCFYNPGAAEHAFGFDAARAKRCLDAAAVDGFSAEKYASCLEAGTAVGAVRASVGLANNIRDVDRLLAVIQTFAA